MHQYDVVIVGAGVAGLVSAKKLRESGLTDVLVLEAQNYIGGRIKSENLWGKDFELGAELVHGKETASWQYLHDSNTELKLMKSVTASKLVSNEGFVYGMGDTELFISLLDEAATNGKLGVSFEDLLISKTPPDKHHISKLTSDILGDYEGGDCDSLDSGAYTISSQQERDGRNLVLPKGYRAMISFLGKDLNIQKSTVVKTIIQNRDGVTISCSSNRNFKAKRVILTVSLGALKRNSIEFTPELPASTKQAIEKLGMGKTVKVLIKFKTPKPVESLFSLSDGSQASFLVADFLIDSWWRSAIDESVIIGFMCGRRTTQLPNEIEIIKQCIEYFSKITRSGIESEFEASKIEHWVDDPPSYGSYSNHPLGISPDVRFDLAKPFKNVYFAGEATNTNGDYATVHGAIETGERAAKEVIESLNQVK